jgi:hypothetical protein
VALRKEKEMARVAQRAVLVVACGVALAGVLLGGTAYAQFFDPQPYLVYEVPPEPVDPTPLVDLEDQFNLWRDVPVLDRWFHMNPVDKIPISPPGNEEMITDPVLHYRWYIVDIDCQYTYDVRVTNQFAEDEPWKIEGDPEFLLAPASKIIGQGEPEPPPPGQHYDCYRVLAAPPVLPAIVDLNDQFGPHGQTEVLDARYLCAPTEKTTADGTEYPIFEAADGRDHLACYELLPEPWVEEISTRDQFTGALPDVGVVVEEKMLCVPTAKTHRLVPSMAPWGIAALGLLILLAVFGVAQHRARQAGPA